MNFFEKSLIVHEQLRGLIKAKFQLIVKFQSEAEMIFPLHTPQEWPHPVKK